MSGRIVFGAAAESWRSVRALMKVANRVLPEDERSALADSIDEVVFEASCALEDLEGPTELNELRDVVESIVDGRREFFPKLLTAS